MTEIEIKTVTLEGHEYIAVIPDPDQFRLDFNGWLESNPSEETRKILDEITDRIFFAEMICSNKDGFLISTNLTPDS